MRRIVPLHDRSEIAAWLRKDAAMNMFGLCNLDLSEWHRTRWHGLDDGGLRAVLLVVADPARPFVVLHDAPADTTGLLGMSTHALPLHAHLSLAMPFDRDLDLAHAHIEHDADYLRMVPDGQTGRRHTRKELVPLTSADFGRIRHLLFEQRAHLDAWLEPRSLRTGLYRGWIENSELLGVAGVHAASPEFRAAVIGNLAVHPDKRGRGIGRILLEDLVHDLHARGWQTAFNVRPENMPAIALYERMGCRTAGTIREFRVTLRRPGPAVPV
jgi:ribosomal protein S18 acetylase RimI-like enzyme